MLVVIGILSVTADARLSPFGCRSQALFTQHHTDCSGRAVFFTGHEPLTAGETLAAPSLVYCIRMRFPLQPIRRTSAGRLEGP
jgi:hypothetical protein